MSSNDLPKVGDFFTVHRLTGYVLTQNRPLECRGWRPSKLNPGQYTGACECGKCDGIRTTHDGTVERIIHWADNSIDIEVRGFDGHLYRHQQTAPHGDVC